MFSEFLYPVVSGGRIPFAGGIEVQLALLGRGLAQRGFDVSVLTCDYGQPDPYYADGITLHKVYPPHGGVPVLRFLHPRLTLGIAGLLRADADVYLFQGASLWAGFVEAVAHARGRRFVWLAGHDHDVLPELPEVHGLRDRWSVRRALRRADALVTQTRWQQARLRANFGRDSVVIMNPVEIPPAAEQVDVMVTQDVVWLSTYKPAKRPTWFIRFAERHPQIRCRMAGVVPGPPLDDSEYRAARAAAASLPNLEVSGAIPHERIGEFLRGAAVFAHSSPAEGFPNTLLESWSLGIPSVSCFDPDGITERERLGAHRVEYEAWEAALERRWAEPALRAGEGARARVWTERYHAPNVIHDQLAAVLRSVLAR
jgi:glycosyltransferase involved in cell wall biosynthesis